MQHVEFFHHHHFESHYHRKWVKGALAQFIDFFWETDFEPLWAHYPGGFSDALFPNVGYTYLINLGTPYQMQLGNELFDMKGDGFLPRYKNMICHHTAGNKIFGIKFKVSPVLLQKKVNFSEYRGYIFPLAYLIDSAIIQKIKGAKSFQKRVELISVYYQKIIEQHSGSATPVSVVTRILHQCQQQNNFAVSIEELSSQFRISSRTLQRYFEKATGVSSKQALQIMRIRKAAAHLATDPATFRYALYGYYDHSHFYKHLKGFLNRHTIDIIQPHLQLLQGAGR